MCEDFCDCQEPYTEIIDGQEVEITEESEVIEYEHHGVMVCVKPELMGLHRDHCLCYECGLFKPQDREANCKIANAVYANCVEFNIVTPVWECPDFTYPEE